MKLNCSRIIEEDGFDGLLDVIADKFTSVKKPFRREEQHLW